VIVALGHSDTYLVGLPWTSDGLLQIPLPGQHTTITTDRHPCPRKVSNPQTQQASSRSNACFTARPPASAYLFLWCVKKLLILLKHYAEFQFLLKKCY